MKSKNKRGRSGASGPKMKRIAGWLLAGAVGVIAAAIVALVSRRSADSPAENLGATNAATSAAVPTMTQIIPTNSAPAPETAGDLVNRGNKLLAQGDAAGAEAFYRRAQKLMPDDEEIYFNLGAACARQGRNEEAQQNYAEALRLFPDYVEAHNNLGNLLLSQRLHAQAIEHFTGSLRLNPENTTALNSLGRAQAEQGKTREAVTNFTEAVRINPAYLEARCNLANAWLLLGNTDGATAQFTEVLRQNPEFPAAIKGLNRIRERKAPGPARP